MGVLTLDILPIATVTIIIGEGEESDPQAVVVFARSGRRIPASRRRSRGPEALKAAVEMLKGLFPGIRNRSLDDSYNCVGLVFASRRALIDASHLPMALAEDGYRECLQPMAGDVVTYTNEKGEMQHVGLVLDSAPDVEAASWRATVLSQWGRDGEYVHALREVPEVYGGRIQFFTERKLPE